MKKIIIAAISENYVLGKNGTMPWHSRDEMKHFKNTTIGFPVIMGRKTFESFKRPLKERLNIVISADKNFKTEFEDVLVMNSLNDAVSYCENIDSEKAFIIGGGEIYRLALDFADEMIISFMKFKIDGDVFFPSIDENLWDSVDEEEYDEFIVKYFKRRE